MNQAVDIPASRRQRIIFLVAGAIMIGFWCWSLLPPIHSWGNPNEDGFSYVPLFYTTLICLPSALFLLIGGVIGRGNHIGRARTALIFAIVIIVLVVLFLIMQYITDNNDGKIFGIQIGGVATSATARNFFQQQEPPSPVASTLKGHKNRISDTLRASHLSHTTGRISFWRWNERSIRAAHAFDYRRADEIFSRSDNSPTAPTTMEFPTT